MKTFETKFYETRLYLGSREGYNGRRYTEEELIDLIGSYQTGCEPEYKIAVRLTPTCFIHCGYHEKGHEIAAILYPRFPKPTENIDKFISGLAKFLLEKLNQNRISVVFPDKIILFESDSAEQTH